MHVDDVAEAGIGIEQHRDVALCGNVTRVIGDVAQPHDAGIRHPQQVAGDLGAGDEKAFEARRLGDPGIGRAEAAGHHRHGVAGKDLAQLAALAGHRLGIGFGHHHPFPAVPGQPPCPVSICGLSL